MLPFWARVLGPRSGPAFWGPVGVSNWCALVRNGHADTLEAIS